DTDSLAAAALLHDIVKTEKHHPEKGALVLKKMGYEKIGSMILAHMDIDVENNDPISEREILYLADKLVQDDQFGKLSIRKAEMLEKFKHQPEALEKINKRYQDAEAIVKKIETVTGKDFWDEQNDLSG
ncbi:MAG: HD domain-containing protein, partial [Acetobacterium sp.]|nr:HD domain-containing protein [Bacillota bacterium]MCG2731064.1 HD domain-containing protein [Acetobacterium sp.]